MTKQRGRRPLPGFFHGLGELVHVAVKGTAEDKDLPEGLDSGRAEVG